MGAVEVGKVQGSCVRMSRALSAHVVRTWTAWRIRSVPEVWCWPSCTQLAFKPVTAPAKKAFGIGSRHGAEVPAQTHLLLHCGFYTVAFTLLS